MGGKEIESYPGRKDTKKKDTSSRNECQFVHGPFAGDNRAAKGERNKEVGQLTGPTHNLGKVSLTSVRRSSGDQQEGV